MREVFATTKWDIDDVLMLQPHWTRAKASEFLTGIENDLEEVMVKAGWDILQDELDMQYLND